MTWSVTLRHNGEDLVDAPIEDWVAATILAEVTVAIFGGPVSVMSAVIAARPPAAPDPCQLDLLAAS